MAAEKSIEGKTMIHQLSHSAQPKEGERTPSNTPTEPQPQVDPARLEQCIGAALRILRGDQNLTVKLVRNNK